MNANLAQDGTSRRDLLKLGALAGGGLLLGIGLGGCSKPAALGGAGGQPVAWLRIGGDDSITVFVDKSEMGQGVYTALTQLLAEELGVALEAIRVEAAPVAPEYVNNLLGAQITGGSTSIRDGFEKLRKAGAQARTMLLQAAATHWGVAPGELRIDGGAVLHGKERLSYGALAEAAAKLPVPKEITLKPATEFTLVGKPAKRIDTAAKLDGSATYGIDVKLPGMLHGGADPDRRRRRRRQLLAREEGARCADARLGRRRVRQRLAGRTLAALCRARRRRRAGLRTARQGGPGRRDASARRRDALPLPRPRADGAPECDRAGVGHGLRDLGRHAVPGHRRRQHREGDRHPGRRDPYPHAVARRQLRPAGLSARGLPGRSGAGRAGGGPAEPDQAAVAARGRHPRRPLPADGAASLRGRARRGGHARALAAHGGVRLDQQGHAVRGRLHRPRLRSAVRRGTRRQPLRGRQRRLPAARRDAPGVGVLAARRSRHAHRAGRGDDRQPSRAHGRRGSLHLPPAAARRQAGRGTCARRAGCAGAGRWTGARRHRRASTAAWPCTSPSARSAASSSN